MKDYNKILSPWRSFLVPRRRYFKGDNSFSRFDLKDQPIAPIFKKSNSKSLWYIGWVPNNKDFNINDFFELKEIEKAIDDHLLKNGYVFYSEEKFNKLKILI